MKRFTRTVAAAGVAAAALAGGQAYATGAEGDQPVVTIARAVIDAAGAFEGYLRTGASVDPAFKNADGVASALAVSAAYQPAQMEDGVVSYAALLAMQDAAFVSGVGVAAGTAEERAALAEQLIANPAAVLDLPDARVAGATVAASVGQMGEGLLARGKAVRQAAYTVQHEKWSLATVAQPQERLGRVKARGLTPVSLAAGDVDALVGGLATRRVSTAPTVPADYKPTPAVTRGLALAAVALLGHAGEDKAEAVAPLLADAESATCLKMAKLNLHQCLAVAGPQYEDVFCLGQHALADTGQCVVNAAGAPAPAPATAPLQVAVARATGVSVPVAMTRVSASAASQPLAVTQVSMSGGR